MGRVTNTAAHATAAHRLRSHSMRATGTAQTQWCDQATGDASSNKTASDSEAVPNATFVVPFA